MNIDQCRWFWQLIHRLPQLSFTLIYHWCYHLCFRYFSFLITMYFFVHADYPRRCCVRRHTPRHAWASTQVSLSTWAINRSQVVHLPSWPNSESVSLPASLVLSLEPPPRSVSSAWQPMGGTSSTPPPPLSPSDLIRVRQHRHFQFDFSLHIPKFNLFSNSLLQIICSRYKGRKTTRRLLSAYDLVVHARNLIAYHWLT